MKTYWDSSALVEAVWEPKIKALLEGGESFTRPHALAEVFSALTGNPVTRIDADDSSLVIAQLAKHLNFVDLTPNEMISALKRAKSLGVRGGRVHDFMHAVAAEKCSAEKILTLDKNDFNGLSKIPVEAV